MIEMNNTVRLYSSYWPPIHWAAAMWQADILRIEACEHYQKSSWRNRCMIAGPNGPQRLSIPLEKGKHQKTPIRDVRIAYHEPWQQLHWRSIQAAYGNAPYFEYYADDIRPFYERTIPYLFDLNLGILELLVKKIGWKGQIETTTTYEATPELLTAPLLLKPYSQVFLEKNGFLSDLSILDLLMCCGKNAGGVL